MALEDQQNDGLYRLAIHMRCFMELSNITMRLPPVQYLLVAACLTSVVPARCVANPMIGDCNLTHFIAGGQKCQRTMMFNLKHKPDANCNLEYGNQTSCLSDHLSSCLTGGFTAFAPSVTLLMQLLLYHCGDLQVDPAVINQLLLNQIQCKPVVFNITVRCWDSFRVRFNNDKKDPQLCKDYAVAKQCVTQEAKTGCAIGQYINRDLFNPFCTYNTDPPLNSSGPMVLIGHCSTQKFAASAYTCQREMMNQLARAGSGSCRQEYAKLKLCLSSTMDTCLTGTSLSPFQDEIHKLVQTLLYHCGSLVADKISANPLILSILNCNKSMFQSAVQCWDEFRLRLILNKFDRQLCVDYARSKRCVSTAVQQGCAIGDLMEEDLYNPFCFDGIDPLRLPSTSVLTSSKFNFVCTNGLFYAKAVTCEDNFLEAIYTTRVITDCRKQSQSFLSCLKTNFEPCIRPSSNPMLLEALGLVVLQSLQGTQLLCDSPIKQIVWDDLPPLLQTVASCGDGYTTEAAECGKTFRSKFIPVPSPLCEEFDNAKNCIGKARESHCSFGIQARNTLMGNYNPFCDNRTRPLFKNAGKCPRVEFKLVFLLFLCFSFVIFG